MRTWAAGREFDEAELRIVADGVISHGRVLAADGHARPIACLLREGGAVVAGACGRTEYGRLFVQSLWVAPPLRRQGLGSEALARLEALAAAEGCRDAVIETLDDRVAALYRRVGYRAIAFIAGYVGPFNRHVLLKPLAPPVAGG